MPKSFNFEEVKKENIFKLNFVDKSFFLSQLEQIKDFIENSDNLKVFALKDDEKVYGIFIVSRNNDIFHISFYTISPQFENEEIIEIISSFLDFLENLAKKEGIKFIYAGVDYYNDELFEKYIEKGFSVISYKLRKEIKG